MDDLVALADVLRLREGPAPAFAELLERLYGLKFTGPVTFHFAGGQPRAVVLAAEVSVPLAPQAPLTSR